MESLHTLSCWFQQFDVPCIGKKRVDIFCGVLDAVPEEGIYKGEDFFGFPFLVANATARATILPLIWGKVESWLPRALFDLLSQYLYDTDKARHMRITIMQNYMSSTVRVAVLSWGNYFAPRRMESRENVMDLVEWMMGRRASIQGVNGFEIFLLVASGKKEERKKKADAHLATDSESL